MAVRRPVVLAVLALTVVGCGGSSGAGPQSPSSPTVPSSSNPAGAVDAGTAPYRGDFPRLATTVLLPNQADAGSALPLVVLVPGGGWESADPTGLRPLAEGLAAQGFATATTTYRTSADGEFFPVPVQDVVCAVDEAVDRLRSLGHPPGPVVVVGHSAGAQLAALAALAADEYQDGCESPRVRPDGLVGLAGPYDVAAAGGLAASLFAAPPAADPGAWAAGNPQRQAGLRPDLRVLLVHGESDQVVPLFFSQTFADALRAGGHDVDLLVVPGVDHQGVYRPAAVQAPIVDFTRSLTGPPGPSSP